MKEFTPDSAIQVKKLTKDKRYRREIRHNNFTHLDLVTSEFKSCS